MSNERKVSFANAIQRLTKALQQEGINVDATTLARRVLSQEGPTPPPPGEVPSQVPPAPVVTPAPSEKPKYEPKERFSLNAFDKLIEAENEKPYLPGWKWEESDLFALMSLNKKCWTPEGSFFGNTHIMRVIGYIQTHRKAQRMAPKGTVLAQTFITRGEAKGINTGLKALCEADSLNMGRGGMLNRHFGKPVNGPEWLKAYFLKQRENYARKYNRNR